MTSVRDIGPDARFALAEHVCVRDFDGDLVVLDLNSGDYLTLNAVGSRMWKALLDGATPREVARALVAEYQAPEDRLLSDCIDLAKSLVARGLVREVRR